MTTNSKFLHSDISDSILKAFYIVRHVLPYDLDLDIYKRALFLEMKAQGLTVTRDKEVDIIFRDEKIGSFVIDFLVNDVICVKIVNNDMTCEPYEADAKKQLRLTKFEIYLLLNFSAETNQQHSRVFLSNDFKQKKDFSENAESSE